MRVTCRQYRTLVALDKAVRTAGRPLAWTAMMAILRPIWSQDDNARAALRRMVDGGLVVHGAAGYRVALEARALLEREHACQDCRPRVAA